VPVDAQSVVAAVHTLKVQAKAGNVTWFHRRERDNPIFFWEQRVRCYHCGRDHFLPALGGQRHGVAGMHHRCCHGGTCVLHREHALPDAMLDLFAYRTGLSSSSCVMNDHFRLCAWALPRGTHQHADAGGGMRVTGVRYALMTNVRERGAARTFLEDPARRRVHEGAFDVGGAREQLAWAPAATGAGASSSSSSSATATWPRPRPRPPPRAATRRPCTVPGASSAPAGAWR